MCERVIHVQESKRWPIALVVVLFVIAIGIDHMPNFRPEPITPPTAMPMRVVPYASDKSDVRVVQNANGTTLLCPANTRSVQLGASSASSATIGNTKFYAQQSMVPANEGGATDEQTVRLWTSPNSKLAGSIIVNSVIRQDNSVRILPNREVTISKDMSGALAQGGLVMYAYDFGQPGSIITYVKVCLAPSQ